MIACIRLPYFAPTLEAQLNPRLADLPLLVANRKVHAVSRSAEQAGAAPGMLLTRARAFCPQAVIVLPTPGRQARALRGLLATLSEFTQWLDTEREAAQTAYVYADLGRLRPREGQVIATEMLTRLHKSHGFEGTVGLAAGKFPARAAARLASVGTVQLVPRGEEAAFLAPLPVTLLPLDRETARRLDLLGLRTLGQLAAIPRPALLAQFGKGGGTLHRLASGEDSRRVGRYTPERLERASFLFDAPIDNRLIVERAIQRLACTLAERLGEGGLTTRELTLLVRTVRGTLEATRRLRQPLDGLLPLSRAARTLLDTLPLRAPVEAVELIVGRLAPVQPRQLALFGAEGEDDVRALLIDMIPRYGESCFYTAALNPQPTALPERRFHLTPIDVA
jgi:nucleotidyltransferase/DNA polymerase involved in DNA repair